MMNFSLNRLRSSLAACLLVLSCSACAKSPPSSTSTTGTISFYQSNESGQCTFAATTRSENLDERLDNCEPFVDGFFQLREVPSATRIWLIFGKHTNENYPKPYRHCELNTSKAWYWWELKTIKEPTTMPDKVRIPDLNTKPIGEVIVPGVRLVGRYADPQLSGPGGNISCLIMQVSP